MLEVTLIGAAILVLRIGQDTLFLAKVDAFNRNNKVYSMSINFIEAMYGITVIKIILDLMQQSLLYLIIFGVGSMLGALLSGTLKSKLDNKLQGQRKYFARISLDNDIDRTELIDTLRERDFEFTVDVKEYLNGRVKTIIQGSLDNRQRMYELKDILRGRPGKHVTILRADDVYVLR
jgi:hypothetical protein